MFAPFKHILVPGGLLSPCILMGSIFRLKMVSKYQHGTSRSRTTWSGGPILGLGNLTDTPPLPTGLVLIEMEPGFDLGRADMIVLHD